MAKTKKKARVLDMLPFLTSVGKEEIQLAKELMFILDVVALNSGPELKAEHILIWWLVRNETAVS